jgi:hypothetical protein
MGLFTQLMRSFTAGLEEPTRTGDGHPSGDSHIRLAFATGESVHGVGRRHFYKETLLWTLRFGCTSRACGSSQPNNSRSGSARYAEKNRIAPQKGALMLPDG